MNQFKPYPRLKDPDVPSLGKVPKHWEVERLRNLAELRVSSVDKHSNEGELPVRLCNYVDVYKNDRIDASMGFMRATAPADEVERFHLEADDVLITKDSEAWNDIGVPALVDGTANDLVCGYHLAILRPFKALISGGYLFRAIQSTSLARQFHVEANGVTRYGLSHGAIKSVWLPVPSAFEQAAIVRFLDHMDRRIRRYIRAKQTLIKLLEEQEQLIIRRVVTRGLDPNVRLKPSGVQWLMDVPRHWEVAALRHRYSQVLGKMLDSKRITGRDLVPYLRNTDVQWDRINVKDLPRMDIAPDEYERYTVRAGDLLVCEGGDVGRAAIWGGGLRLCGFQKALHRLRPFDAGKDVPRFLYYALRAAAKSDAFSDGHVSTIAHLTGEKLRGHLFPFPPMTEQASIARWLDATVESVRRAAKCAARQVALLREYRAGLIADVVTGKLDVRDAVAELPDERDERAPLDEPEGDASADGLVEDKTDDAPEPIEA